MVLDTHCPNVGCRLHCIDTLLAIVCEVCHVDVSCHIASYYADTIETQMIVWLHLKNNHNRKDSDALYWH